jgi:hypothetical protein
MRHDSRISISSALPDAPLAMPRQVLERHLRASLFSALRAAFAAALPRF